MSMNWRMWWCIWEGGVLVEELVMRGHMCCFIYRDWRDMMIYGCSC